MFAFEISSLCEIDHTDIRIKDTIRDDYLSRLKWLKLLSISNAMLDKSSTFLKTSFLVFALNSSGIGFYVHFAGQWHVAI